MTTTTEAIEVTVLHKSLECDDLDDTSQPDPYTAIVLHLGGDTFMEVDVYDRPEEENGLRLFFTSDSGPISGSELRKIRSFFVSDPRIQALCENNEL